MAHPRTTCPEGSTVASMMQELSWHLTVAKQQQWRPGG